MLAFAIRRLVQMAGVMLVVALISFLMFRFVGDPVNQLVGVDSGEYGVAVNRVSSNGTVQTFTDSGLLVGTSVELVLDFSQQSGGGGGSTGGVAGGTSTSTAYGRRMREGSVNRRWVTGRKNESSAGASCPAAGAAAGAPLAWASAPVAGRTRAALTATAPSLFRRDPVWLIPLETEGFGGK